MARRLSKGKRKGAEIIFLPDHLDQVKAIAMQGLTDSEMAGVFGIKPKQIKRWREFYPSFNEAIEKGRTGADVAVVQALFKKAIGYSRDKDVVFGAKKGEPVVLTVTEHFEPETNAIKYWLNNRKKEHFADRSHQQVTGKRGEPTVDGLPVETKMQVMASILSLISPKADGDT